MNKQKRPALSLSKGFTLIELIVVIAIITVLSGIILFSITQYINKGKDSNIFSNLTILIPAGEVYYNGNGNSYNDGLANFCDPSSLSGNSIIRNAISQMPDQSYGAPCYDGTIPLPYALNLNPKGVCCYAQSQSWAACAREFADSTKAYCVDSRGAKGDMCKSSCNQVGLTDITTGSMQCPNLAEQTNCQ